MGGNADLCKKSFFFFFSVFLGTTSLKKLPSLRNGCKDEFGSWKRAFGIFQERKKRLKVSKCLLILKNELIGG